TGEKSCGTPTWATRSRNGARSAAQKEERSVRKMRKKSKMPMPVNLNDCCLLYQMGYRVEINDGKVTTVAKERKKKTA
ncbi:hypothetical protein, partial [Rhodanobacter fulvus]|uniref:hypothetical protein n=1 Tax=Rhodanobacter fulvus TaxID=219571 RepID=UPI001ED90F82